MSGWRHFCWAWRPSEHFFGLRIWRVYFRVKGPQAVPLFSERHGFDAPALSVKGWRLFVTRREMKR
jgi:hypothetical protein